MQLELSGANSKLINALIASGRFQSPEEVIEKALASLNAHEMEFEATVADVQASLEDEQAGRVSSIQDAAGRIREQHGFTRLS